ncbi:Phosphohistidine phosphatase SixA [Rubrobacter radiotolerans]|uniref:Histidine phosphatase family protein n=1 Tax=Rubrobacter radiotolerans TaxID=42256 RepID=A0A023X092_RUBRA|nr:histidine phosphatase family protein [Rubrobacter radiotolerans]AHY45591.1 Phosphohistidine phosphatase SixA [Rubrobacter radiotolerans]MDX5893005.1 histidine phosphatase family protein [Rubrobacter radiotolerans]SMC02890.1 phosphohistidine phosphatase, SixA [Rubrobacter radiotolerans DSM 5868]
MDLYLVRHAIACNRDPDAWPDDSKRPLSRRGVSRFREVAREISRLVQPPGRVLSSPFTRAWSTAEILRDVAGWPEPESFPALEPEVPPQKTVRALADLAQEETVALVGHRPNLHELAAYLLTGEAEGLEIKIKKGGALYVRFADGPEPGAGELRWHLTPKIMLHRETFDHSSDPSA